MPNQRKRRSSRLFTVVMEFERTTSVAQFRSFSVGNAVKQWVRGLRKPRADGLTDAQRTRLAKGYEDYEVILGMDPAPLHDLQNAWCTTLMANDKGSALLNIIGTSSTISN